MSTTDESLKRQDLHFPGCAFLLATRLLYFSVVKAIDESG